MANDQHLAILNQGVEAWNQWRQETRDIPDLSDSEHIAANLGGASFTAANLSRTNLLSANLSRTDFRKAILSHANLCTANLSDADLSNANLSHANLNHANLNHANLSDANLSGSDLSGADLSSANLSGADLMLANLSVANLRDANLIRANIIRGNLVATDLTGASLISTVLAFADFSVANLSRAKLNRADLSSTHLGGAILYRADLQNAITLNTGFGNCDLSEVKGLDLIKHEGPSTIGIDTIYKSKGRISETFLRGCGVPESLITQMYSLVGAEDGIQFYSCFISYTSRDDELARRLHGKMRDARLRVWFAPEDIQGGKKLHEQIETAIRVYDKLLIVLSEASLESEWVMTELRKARKAERQSGKRKLFPVRLVDMNKLQSWECIDPDTGEDLALEVRRYFIPDFSNWKDHDHFETAFSRLLKDLRADERAK